MTKAGNKAAVLKAKARKQANRLERKAQALGMRGWDLVNLAGAVEFGYLEIEAEGYALMDQADALMRRVRALRGA